VSELPDDLLPAPIPAPKDASLGIVLRRGREGGREVLLGRRSRGSRFMPGNLAFPGGRLDPADGPASPEAFARCASRELLEETGLSIAPAAWHAAGLRTTPPIFPVRFRTIFFVAELPDGAAIPDALPSPDELESLSFEAPRSVLTAWESGRALVPPPLLPILRLLAERPEDGLAELAAAIAAINAVEEPTPRIEFVPGTWMFPVRTRTLPPASCTNVWMPGGRRFLVIDPGSDDPEENARLLAVVARRVAAGATVEAVVLSHHHRDHAAGAGAIAAALGVPVLAHAETFSRLASLPAGVRTRTLADGDVLELDGLALRVVHTPGHAPGHLAFFDPARRVLIAGDLVSGLSTILVGLDDGDMDAYLDALRRAAALDPKTVLPSHGPPLPGKALAEALAHREAREARILAGLSDGAPHALSAIAEWAYADTPGAPVALRELQAGAHLKRLVRRGAIEEAGGGYRIPGTSIMS